MRALLLLSLFALVMSADAKSSLTTEWTDMVYHRPGESTSYAQFGLRSDGVVVWRRLQ